VLAAECRDPQIVAGDRLTFLLEFETDDRIRMSGLIIDVEYCDGSDPFSEPVLITCPVAGLRDSKAVLTEHNHGDG